MFKPFATILLVLASLAQIQEAKACSCVSRNIPDLFKDSDVVYIGEVSAVKLVTKKPKHNARVSYDVEIRPLKIFKGRNPGIQKAWFSSTYHDQSLLLPSAAISPDTEGLEEGVEELVEMVVNSCDHPFRVGEVLLVLKKRDEPFGQIGYCTRRVVMYPTSDLIDMIEKLSP